MDIKKGLKRDGSSTDKIKPIELEEEDDKIDESLLKLEEVPSRLEKSSAKNSTFSNVEQPKENPKRLPIRQSKEKVSFSKDLK
mmetsp:Transcript_26566/g.23549  ORF Transcript_26566/g.23549 Transcript_26566/m.23549 type:complete len:83 (+) Transcript_26566:926-1174(+)